MHENRYGLPRGREDHVEYEVIDWNGDLCVWDNVYGARRLADRYGGTVTTVHAQPGLNWSTVSIVALPEAEQKRRMAEAERWVTCYNR